jgi:hypothetical protein
VPERVWGFKSPLAHSSYYPCVGSNQALLITGTIGVGKTAVVTELGELLESRGNAAAIIDLDWLGWVTTPSPAGPNELIIRNLAAMWPNFRAAGIDFFVLSRTITDPAQVEDLRRALPEASLRVVRLVASPTAIEDRLTHRDTGKILEQHLAEARRFLGAASGIEDVTVANDNRSVREVAQEILDWSGWQ